MTGGEDLMKPKRINIEFGNYGTLITAHVGPMSNI